MPEITTDSHYTVPHPIVSCFLLNYKLGHDDCLSPHKVLLWNVCVSWERSASNTSILIGTVPQVVQRYGSMLPDWLRQYRWHLADGRHVAGPFELWCFTFSFGNQLVTVANRNKPPPPFCSVNHPSRLSNEIVRKAYVWEIKGWKRGHCSSNLTKKNIPACNRKEPSSGSFWHV